MMLASNKKAQPFSKGLSLLPAPPQFPTGTNITQSDKYLGKHESASGAKNGGGKLTYGIDDKLTETTKANECSKPTLEEST